MKNKKAKSSFIWAFWSFLFILTIIATAGGAIALFMGGSLALTIYRQGLSAIQPWYTCAIAGMVVVLVLVVMYLVGWVYPLVYAAAKILLFGEKKN